MVWINDFTDEKSLIVLTITEVMIFTSTVWSSSIKVITCSIVCVLWQLNEFGYLGSYEFYEFLQVS